MDKNEVDNFLDGLDDAPKDALEPDNTDPFADKDSVESKPDLDNEEDVKPLPFNKDPKIQKFIQKEIAKGLADAKPTEAERFVKDTVTSKEEQDEILSSLTEIVGNDTPQKVAAVNRLRKALAEGEDRAVKKAVEHLETVSQQEQQKLTEEETRAEQELEDGFENIEEQFGVDLYAPTNKKLKDEFIDFIIRVAPKDKQGEVVEYPDFQETFKLFKDTRKTPNNRAKELSSRSMTRSGDASTVPSGGKSWSDVEKLFSKLEK